MCVSVCVCVCVCVCTRAYTFAYVSAYRVNIHNCRGNSFKEFNNSEPPM